MQKESKAALLKANSKYEETQNLFKGCEDHGRIGGTKQSINGRKIDEFPRKAYNLTDPIHKGLFRGVVISNSSAIE